MSIDCNADIISFDGVFNGDASDGKFTFRASSNDYRSGDLAPGVYVVEIEGTVDGSNGLAKQTATIEITLLDPCDPPRSVGSPVLQNQQYTLNDLSRPFYKHPNFIADPSYCKLSYSYEISKILDDEGNEVSAITQQPLDTFTFEYTKDLAPVRPVPQKQVV